MRPIHIPALLLVVAGLVLTAPRPAPAGLALEDPQRGVLTLAPVLERATPAVVNIAVRSLRPDETNPLLRDPFFRRFFGLPDIVPRREVLSAGSGVIVDAEKGLVVTNNHVVEGAEEIVVTLKDRRTFRAELVGADPATDLALLRIPAENLTALPFADSDRLQVGDVVLAIGNPFGLGQTVTSGIVSALGRSGIAPERYESFIQTDAPINPGNSGGALIDTRGRLVGINTAIISPAGGNVGIGFAVPANMVKAVIAQLEKYGEVRRGRIGVVVQDLTPDLAEALGIAAEGGAVVSQVQPGSPAERAGLRPGDVVVAIDGHPVRGATDLRNRIGLAERGTTVTLTVIRDGERLELPVTIGTPEIAALETGRLTPRLAGALVTEIPEDHPARDRVQGVYVARVVPGSPAWRFGLREGDIVLAVNRREVRTVAEFQEAVRRARGALALDILRGNMRIFLLVR